MRNFTRTPANVAGFFIMCLFYTIAYATSSGLFFFLFWTKYTHQPVEAFDFAMMIFLVVLFLCWPAFLQRTKPAALPGWQTAPIRHYAFESKTNEGRTLRLSELNLTADERADLKRFAEMRQKNPDVTFTAVSVKTYRTLKDKLMASKWLEWNMYNSQGRPVLTYGVRFTEDGAKWLAELLPPPVEDVPQNIHLYPHTHTVGGQK